MTGDSALIDSLRSLVGDAGLAPPGKLADYAVDGITPAAAVCPETPEQVAAVLAAARAGAGVIPWGGGSSIATGNLPEHYDVALDVTRLNQIVDHEPADLTVIVQAGIRLKDLQEQLGRSGQHLPLDPPSPETATVGGVLASNAGGPWRHAYGWPRDWTLGIKVALPDGTIAKAGGRVVKNVAGYDMTKLYIGSFGTLGVIVEAAFKVTPLPESRATTVAFFDTCASACEAGLTLHQRNLAVESLAVASPGAELVKQAGIDPPSASWALLVAAAGGAGAVERTVRETEELCREQGAQSIQSLSADSARGLWEGVRALTLPPRGAGNLLTRAALLPSQVAAFLEGLPQRARESGLTGEAVAYLGVGSVYGLLGAGERGVVEGGAALVSSLRAAAAQAGGVVVVMGCPADLKEEIDVWGEPRGDISLMRRIKEQLDPLATLSPGRFVGRI